MSSDQRSAQGGPPTQVRGPPLALGVGAPAGRFGRPAAWRARNADARGGSWHGGRLDHRTRATIGADIRGRPGFDVVGSPAELQAEVPGRPRKTTGNQTQVRMINSHSPLN